MYVCAIHNNKIVIIVVIAVIVVAMIIYNSIGHSSCGTFNNTVANPFPL